MARQNWKGSVLLAPVPAVMVSCGDEEQSNIITVAWTGVLCTHPPKTYVSIRPQRHSYNLIKKTGEFVINIPSADIAKAIDFCGIYTGAKVDKFERCKLTRTPSKEVSAPTIAECKVALECRVCDVVPLGTHDMFVADIVSVSVDDSILDENGKLCMERANLCAFAHGEYFTLGKKVGEMGFSATKKRPFTQKNNAKKGKSKQPPSNKK